MSESHPGRGQSLRTILETVLAGLLVWSGKTLMDVHTTMASMEVEMKGVRTQLADLPKLEGRVEAMRVQMERNTLDVRDLLGLRATAAHRARMEAEGKP
jgi:hypothetical protein